MIRRRAASYTFFYMFRQSLNTRAPEGITTDIPSHKWNSRMLDYLRSSVPVVLDDA